MIIIMEFSRSELEKLKDEIDKLDENEHVQLYQIVTKYTQECTKTKNGVLISSNNLSVDCLLEMRKYVTFCIDQRKRIEDDLKTRKIYERMINE